MRRARAGGVQLPQAETHVLADGQVWKQRVVLEHHADAAALRGNDVAGTAHVFAVDGDAPGRDLLESGDAPQRGGLAAAARAEYAADPARSSASENWSSTRWPL